MPSQKTRPADYPQAVIRQIELLAQHIVVARKRRRETQAQWAKRLGVSQPTMARVERGDPSVAMATYVMCMWLIKPSMALADLIAPQTDEASLELEVALALRRGAAKAHRPNFQVTATARTQAHKAVSQSAKNAAGLAALIAKPQKAAP